MKKKRKQKKAPGVKESLYQLTDYINKHFRGQCGIVYCLSQKDTEAVAFFLARAKIPCECYHAGEPARSEAAASCPHALCARVVV
jgi:superfamily II DNA helicase RecQ